MASGSISQSVAPALAHFPIVDPSTGVPSLQFFQAWQSVVNGVQPSDVTLASSGSSYSAQWAISAQIGQFVLNIFDLTFATPGASGNLQVGTFPAPANASSTGQASGWLAQWGGLTLSAGYTQLGLAIGPGSDIATVMQSGSGLTAIPLPMSGVASGARLVGAIFYPT